MSDDIRAHQLRETCKLTGASWAVDLHYLPDTWVFGAACNLSKAGKAALHAFLQDVEVARWISGSLASGRMRMRTTGVPGEGRLPSETLKSGGLYLFPNHEQHRVLMVAAGNLGATERKFFQILSMSGAPPEKDLETAQHYDTDPPDEAAYGYRQALERILKTTCTDLGCEAACIAICQGETFRLEHAVPQPPLHPGGQLPDLLSHTLVEIGKARAVKVMRSPEGVAALAGQLGVSTPHTVSTPHDPEGGPEKAWAAWLGVPVLGEGTLRESALSERTRSGQRVIAVLIYLDSRPELFTAALERRAYLIAQYYAYRIENALIFAEVEKALQRLAILNEVASAASERWELEKVARRVLGTLGRTFRTTYTTLLVTQTPSMDPPPGKRPWPHLLEYGARPLGEGRLPGGAQATGNDEREGEAPGLDLGAAVMRGGRKLLVLDGRPMTPFAREVDLRPGVHSALGVPLIYRREVIGALLVECEEPDAFTLQDEQLLGVIASHLAGFIANLRLNDETLDWAHKLNVIHQIVQVVAGKDQLMMSTSMSTSDEIARYVADVVAVRFECDLTLLLHLAGGPETGLAESFEQEKAAGLNEISPEAQLRKAGAGGKAAGLLGEVTRFSARHPLLVEALANRRSTLRTDANVPRTGWLAPEWMPGSMVCVPLQAGGQLLGLFVAARQKNLAFNEGDVQVFEALAGVLASVMLNARRYQQLEAYIHRQRIADEQLVRSARLAAVGELASGVAHELNNPLTTIAGFAELLLKETKLGTPGGGQLNAQQHDDLELILQEAQRARSVVRRLLDFTRQGGAKVLADVNEIINDVLMIVNYQAHTCGVQLLLELWDGLPPVYLDRNQIKQVLLNLVQNGLQAMPEGGILTVQTALERKENRPWVVIQVSDTGVGIPAANLEKIFEPFFTTKPAGEGTGLGLSISMNILTDHGGSIEVESIPGEGARFTVWLPESGYTFAGQTLAAGQGKEDGGQKTEDGEETNDG